MKSELKLESLSDLGEYNELLERELSEPSSKLSLCDVYAKIRPVLVFAANFPLLPGGIRKGLQLLIAALDTACHR